MSKKNKEFSKFSPITYALMDYFFTKYLYLSKKNLYDNFKALEKDFGKKYTAQFLNHYVSYLIGQLKDMNVISCEHNLPLHLDKFDKAILEDTLQNTQRSLL